MRLARFIEGWRSTRGLQANHPTTRRKRIAYCWKWSKR